MNNNPIRAAVSESFKRAEAHILDAVAHACAANTLLASWRVLPGSGPVGLNLRLEIFPDPMLSYDHLNYRRTYQWLRPLFHLPVDLPGRKFTYDGEELVFWGAAAKPPTGSSDRYFIHANPKTGTVYRTNASWVREHVVGRRVTRSLSAVLTIGLLENERHPVGSS